MTLMHLYVGFAAIARPVKACCTCKLSLCTACTGIHCTAMEQSLLSHWHKIG